MVAAEVVAQEWAKESVQQTDSATNEVNVNALYEGDHVGVATQVIAEMVECAQPLLCLADEVGVVLVGIEAGGVVEVCNLDAGLSQLFAPEHVLVAIVAETLVEGVGNDDVATYHEIAGMKV